MSCSLIRLLSNILFLKKCYKFEEEPAFFFVRFSITLNRHATWIVRYVFGTCLEGFAFLVNPYLGKLGWKSDRFVLQYGAAFVYFDMKSNKKCAIAGIVLFLPGFGSNHFVQNFIFSQEAMEPTIYFRWWARKVFLRSFDMVYVFHFNPIQILIVLNWWQFQTWSSLFCFCTSTGHWQ